MVEFEVLLLDLAVLIVAAEVGGIVFERMRLPRVVGMLVAGVALSRLAGGFAVAPEDVESIAQLGAVFLMFSIGLSFNVADFRRLGTKATLLSVNGSGLSFVLGYAVGVTLQWDQASSLFLGLMIMSTSTLVSFRLMQDLNMLGMRGADVAIAGVLMDDVTILIALTVVQSVAGAGSVDVTSLLVGIAIVLALLTIIALLGLKTIPAALSYFERVSPTSIVLLATSACFFIAFLFEATALPGLLGAFLAGTIIASTKHGGEVQKWIEPISALFTAVFFTAIGLLIDPALFLVVWLPLLLLLAAAIVGKAVGGFLSLASFRVPLYPAAMFSMILIPRGEMTLVVATIAVGRDARPEILALGALLMIVTTVLSPLGVKLVGQQASFFEQLWQRVRRDEKVEEPPASAPSLGAAPEGEKKG